MKKFLGILGLGGLLLAGLPSPATAQEMDVETFVQQIYVEGIPYEAANAYGAEAAPRLLEMLADSSQAPYWANIVVTLCIIGEESFVEPLIDFIKRDEGTLSEGIYRAKSSAVMALGYLINKTGNETALNYLIESLNPDVWGGPREVVWTGPFQASTEARDAQLSTMAMLGLALSGRPEAAEALRTTSMQRFEELQPGTSNLVDVALEAHQQIAEQGLAEYYRSQRAGFPNQ